MLNKADRIEERSARQRKRQLRHLEIGARTPTINSLDDTVPELTMAAGGGNALEIISATTGTCTALGYSSTSQLVGMHSCQILPEPVRSVWQTRMEAIVRNGFGPYLGFAEVGLVQTINGAVKPCVLSLKEATPDEDTSRPRLQLALDPLSTQDNILVFAGKQQNFKILCASQRSLTLLGSDAHILEKEPQFASKWLPSLQLGEASASAMELQMKLGLSVTRELLGISGGSVHATETFGGKDMSSASSRSSEVIGSGEYVAALEQLLDAVAPMPQKNHTTDSSMPSAHERKPKVSPVASMAATKEIRRMLLIVLAEGASADVQEAALRVAEEGSVSMREALGPRPIRKVAVDAKQLEADAAASSAEGHKRRLSQIVRDHIDKARAQMGDTGDLTSDTLQGGETMKDVLGFISPR